MRAHTPPSYYDATRRWLLDALRGAVRSHQAHLLTNTGVHLLAQLEFALVGRGASQGLLVTVMHWQEVQPKALLGRDVDYEIMLAKAFAMVRLVVDGDNLQVQANTNCFQALHEREQPCEDCPVLRRDTDAWPRVAVRCVKLDERRDGFEIVTADKVAADASLVHIRSRKISGEMVEAIHAAKVQHLADRAALSPREREILTYLVLGRSAEDIATLVGIAQRTVKYHQANVLEKLGADSRADLMRLLF